MVTQSSPKKPAVRSTAPRKRASKPSPTEPDVDSPFLPVEQLEGLRKIKPDAVDWVMQQTQLEAEHRRAETARVNDLIFIEHMLAQVSALLIGVAGILGGSWVAVRGQPWVGFAIAATVVAGLVVAHAAGKKKGR